MQQILSQAGTGPRLRTADMNQGQLGSPAGLERWALGTLMLVMTRHSTACTRPRGLAANMVGRLEVGLSGV